MCMYILYTGNQLVLTELNGLLLTTVASRNGIHSNLVLRWKGGILDLNIVSQNVP